MMKALLKVLVIVCLSLLNLQAYLHAGVPYTHDGDNHVARFANYKVAIKEGQFPPRFAPNLMNHYGYPVFNYNYPLANIVSLPFSMVKLPYSLTFKILMSLSLVGGLIGVAWWLTELGFSSKAQMFGMVAFGTAPYLLTTIVHRGNVGELMAMCLLPWLLIAMEKMTRSGRQESSTWLWLGSLLFGMYLLAHNVAAVFGLPFIIGYGLVRYQKQWRSWLKFGLMLGVGLGLSLWFWLPALAEKSQVVLDRAGLSQEYSLHFPTLRQLIFAPVSFGFSFPGQVDSLSLSLGLLQVVLLLLATITLLYNRSEKKVSPLEWSSLIIAWLLIGFQLSFTLPIWNVVPFVRYIQFPWRLSLFWPLTMALLSAGMWDKLRGGLKRLVLVLLLIQVLTLARVKAVDYRDYPNLYYEAFGESTTTLNENLPQDFKYLNLGDWQPGPTILVGEGEITVNSWNGSRRSYDLKLAKPSVIVEPTMAFLGWETRTKSTVTSEFKSVAYKNDDLIQGRLAYQLDAGEYHVESAFTQNTWARKIGNGVTGLSLVGLLCWLVMVIGRSRIKIKS